MVTEVLVYHGRLRRSEINRDPDFPVRAGALVAGALAGDFQAAGADELVHVLWEGACLAGSSRAQQGLGRRRWARSCVERSPV